MIHVLMLLAGAALAAVNAWQRLGRSSAARRWARNTHRDFAQRNVLVLWPLISAALVVGAAIGLADRVAGAAVPLSLLLMLLLGTWLAFAALPLPVPRFVMPRWYREQIGTPRERSRG